MHVGGVDSTGIVITNERRECGDLKMIPQKHEIATLSPQ